MTELKQCVYSRFAAGSLTVLLCPAIFAVRIRQFASTSKKKSGSVVRNFFAYHHKSAQKKGRLRKQTAINSFLSP